MDAGKEPPDQVTIRLAGELTVVRGDDVLRGTGIGSRQARLLLGVLAVERARRVRGDEIVERIWPQRPPKRPAQGLAVLVSRLRAVLGPGVLSGGRDGYRLAAAPTVRVDVDEAAALTGESHDRLRADQPALALSAATRALELLAPGPILDGAGDADWVCTARARGVALLRDARHATATAGLRARDQGAARLAAEAAVATDELDEVAYRLLMAVHRAAGEPARAVAAYERLRHTLAEQLGVDPAPSTRELHLAVLREHRLPHGSTRRSVGRPTTDAKLVGRSMETSRLSSAWSAAAGGAAGTVLVAGEAGVGKTRLAEALAETADATGGTVLRARCYATERSLFLQPLVDALTPTVTAMSAAELLAMVGPGTDALAGIVPEVATLIGTTTTRPASVEVERRRIFEAVTSLLRGLALRRPLLLLVDDLHNAGLGTVELLHYAARRVSGSRLLVLATVRSEEGHDALTALADVSSRVEVGPLPEPAVAELAAAAGRPEHAAEIARRTRGHTLFVVEVLRGLVAGETGLPASLRDAVLSRLARAAPGTEELLRAAAVLGATVEPATVAELLGQPLTTALHRCEAAAAVKLLVEAGPRYEFANDLVHELLYATTPAPARASYHRLAADLLVDQPEAAAGHAAAVEDWPRAARSWLLAGERALRGFAGTDAEALMSRALRAAERTDDLGLVARVQLARGRARDAMAAFDDALADLQAGVGSARRAGDRRLEMVGLRELGGDVPVALGRPIVETVEHLDAGLRIARTLGDRGAQADLLARSAVIGSNRLRFTEALGHARRAVSTGRAAGDDEALAKGLDGLRNVLAYLGEVDEMAGVVAELEPLLRAQGDLWRLQWTAFESSFMPLAACDWDVAADRIDEAVAVGHRRGYEAYRPFFLAHRGWLERLRGRYDQALRYGRPAGTRHSWATPGAAALLAGTLLELGRTDAATELLRDVVSLTEHKVEAYRLRCLAPLAEATGSGEVLTEADRLLAAIDAPTGSAWLLGADAYLSVARAWLTRGEPERARAALAPLLAAAARVPWPALHAQALLVDGRIAAALGDVAAAGAALRRSAGLAERHGLPEIGRQARRVSC